MLDMFIRPSIQRSSQQLGPLIHHMSTIVKMSSSQNFDFQDVFSPTNKARTIADLLNKHGTSRIENFINDNMKRKAAVLVPLCYDLEGRPSILYNLRSKKMSKHKGQISFPGGSVDPEDNDDLVVTALRETEEELGISRNKVEVWLTLPFVPTVSSLVRVAPVVGIINEPMDASKLKINPGEVEFAFTVPLQHLCDPKNWSVTTYAAYTLPAYKNLEEFMGNECVELWGLTAMITHSLLLELAPKVYQRNDVSYNNQMTTKPKL